eukprot:1365731-Amorphochlora_amoeboformis.AAC.2
MSATFCLCSALFLLVVGSLMSFLYPSTTAWIKITWDYMRLGWGMWRAYVGGGNVGGGNAGGLFGRLYFEDCLL